jgi:hypothetical protein
VAAESFATGLSPRAVLGMSALEGGGFRAAVIAHASLALALQCRLTARCDIAHKHLLFRSEAREKVLRGVGAIADAVRVTLGPRSRCVLIERKWANRSCATTASRSPRNSR